MIKNNTSSTCTQAIIDLITAAKARGDDNAAQAAEMLSGALGLLSDDIISAADRTMSSHQYPDHTLTWGRFYVDSFFFAHFLLQASLLFLEFSKPEQDGIESCSFSHPCSHSLSSFSSSLFFSSFIVDGSHFFQSHHNTMFEIFVEHIVTRSVRFFVCIERITVS